jgi:hypothetical protein
MVKHDTDLYDLTIGHGRTRAVIDTTRNHLFYLTWLTIKDSRRSCLCDLRFFDRCEQNVRTKPGP